MIGGAMKMIPYRAVYSLPILSNDVFRPKRVAWLLKQHQTIEEVWGKAFFPGAGTRGYIGKYQVN